jgi:methyl-accepting chemotaxis protein
MFLSSMKFSTRIISVFGFVILCLMSVGVLMWNSTQNISETAKDSSLRLIPQFERIARIELNIVKSSLLVRHAMLVKTPEDLKITLGQIGERKEIISKSFKEFSDNMGSDSNNELVKKMSEQIDTFWKVGGANLEMIQNAKKDEAFDHLVATLVPARNDLLNTIETTREYQQKLLEGKVLKSVSQTESVRFFMALLIALIIGVSTVFSLYFSKALRLRVEKATAIASAISQGDLKVEINTSGQDEFVPMLKELSHMQNALGQVVGQVRQAADSISTASTEVAAGNTDLSMRTEQTASNLQQTASSVNQINGMVQQTAGSAQEATKLAQSAADVAAKGGEVVSQVVETMNEIQTSSRKISEIIAVIDGIAFQTNILALNAAVEAARAGEQGRGFAVVASEVRTLAQRSAEAAREIKTLIGASVAKVETGNQLVQNAGTTMGEIVQSVQRVSDMINEIMAATHEQAGSINEVNTSVVQLDQMTQQNAALVEQSAAAAESLKEQAHKLSQVVGIFKLNPIHQ